MLPEKNFLLSTCWGLLRRRTQCIPSAKRSYPRLQAHFCAVLLTGIQRCSQPPFLIRQFSTTNQISLFQMFLFGVKLTKTSVSSRQITGVTSTKR